MQLEDITFAQVQAFLRGDYSSSPRILRNVRLELRELQGKARRKSRAVQAEIHSLEKHLEILQQEVEVKSILSKAFKPNRWATYCREGWKVYQSYHSAMSAAHHSWRKRTGRSASAE